MTRVITDVPGYSVLWFCPCAGGVARVTHCLCIRATAADGCIEKRTPRKQMRKDLLKKTSERMNLAPLA